MLKPIAVLGVLVALGLLAATLASQQLASPLFVIAVLAAAWAWQADAQQAIRHGSKPAASEPEQRDPHLVG